MNKVWVLPGKGDGTFLTPLATPTGTGSGYLSYIDLDHDGNLDVVIADQLASAMAVMKGKGDGTFQPANEYVVAAQPTISAPIPLDDGTTVIVSPDSVSGAWVMDFAASDGTLPNAPLLTLGKGPAAIAAGDLNADQRPDLVITDPAARAIYVELASGAGQFGSPVTYSLGTQPGALRLADLNGDGKLDVIAADATGVDVLLGAGNGALGAVKTFSAGGALSSITIADFNGDGKPDVAAANPTGAVISLFLGNGDGTLQGVQSIPLGGGLIPLAVESGDFDGDGKPDLMVAYSSGAPTAAGGLAVLLGKGDGSFQAPALIDLGAPLISAACWQREFRAAAGADINHDGKLDVATVLHSGTSNQVALLYGTGAGSFAAPSLIPTQTAPPMMIAADLNRTGQLDLVLADCCGLVEASHIINNGDGTFKEIQFASGPNPRALASADFDGDGYPDLAVVGDDESRSRYDGGSSQSGMVATTPAATPTSVSPITAGYSAGSQTVTLTATVTSNSIPVSGGTVTFSLLGATATANVSNGMASRTCRFPAEPRPAPIRSWPFTTPPPALPAAATPRTHHRESHTRNHLACTGQHRFRNGAECNTAQCHRRRTRKFHLHATRGNRAPRR